MAINYSFTPSELIDVRSATTQQFTCTIHNFQTDEDMSKTTQYLITDTSIYNSFCNFIGNHLEVSNNNLNIKDQYIKTAAAGNYNPFDISWPQSTDVYQIKTDLIIPVCIYNNIQNYYITLWRNDNSSYQYMCILYPESQMICPYAYTPNAGSAGLQLYNINENVFILVNDLNYIGDNRQNIIFYEDYCLGDRDEQGQYNKHYYNSSTAVLSQLFPLIKESSNTGKIAIYPLTSLESSNKLFEGIYGSTLTNYNNEEIRADGITYLVLGRRGTSTMGYVVSSEILGRE